MKWKEEDVNFLRSHYSSSLSLKEICSYLQRSRRAVLHKAARLGLARVRKPHNKPLDPNHRKNIDKKYYNLHRHIIYKKKRMRVYRYKAELVSLMGGKCNKCGYDRCYGAFDFHHALGKKENMIATLLKGASKDKLLKEAKKCILLCANCHRELHYKGA